MDAHDKHAGHSVAMFRNRFRLTLLLAVPTVVWSAMIQHWFGYTAPGGPDASRWIPAIFGSLVFAYGGWVFIRGAAGELANRTPGMMTLIALAISVAFGFSLAVTFGFPGIDLWWELATLIAIMVLGHWIEMRSISQAQGALKELAKLLPDMAVRVVGDRTEEVPASDLREGDRAGFPIVRLGRREKQEADGERRDRDERASRKADGALRRRELPPQDRNGGRRPHVGREPGDRGEHREAFRETQGAFARKERVQAPVENHQREGHGGLRDDRHVGRPIARMDLREHGRKATHLGERVEVPRPGEHGVDGDPRTAR